MEFFEKLSAKAKVVLGVIGSIIGFILLVVLGRKISAKSKLNHELEKVQREADMLGLEKDFEEKEEKLSSLRDKEIVLRDKIKEVEEREYKGEEVSVEEIDDFFKKRGLL